jgi:hypothetical protein
MKRSCHILQQNVFRTKDNTNLSGNNKERGNQSRSGPQGKVSRIELPSSKDSQAMESSEMSSKDGGERFKHDKSRTTWSKASTRPETVEQEDRLQSLKQEM